MSFKGFLEGFNLEELRRAKKLDWSSLIKEAEKRVKERELCPNCRKNKIIYHCTVRKIKEKDPGFFVFYQSFCSLKCLKDYINKNTKVEKIKEPTFPTIKLKDQAISYLDMFELERLKRLKEEEIKAWIEKKIKRREN